MAVFVLLVVAGIVCLLAEAVLPGGVVGALGVLCLVGAVVTAYVVFESQTAHVIVMVFAVLGLTGVVLWMRFFPKSRLGQRFVAQQTIGKIAVDYKKYLDKEGVAETPLRPAGKATIAGERVDVVTEGPLIEPGVRIKVIEATGNRLLVRAVQKPS